MAEEKSIEQLQQELAAAKQTISEQNQVVSDLKGRLKVEKAQVKKGNPKVSIEGEEYEITILKARYRQGDQDTVITAEKIQTDEALAKKLLDEGFGGLKKVKKTTK